ncbi:hypothetical protein LSTR_LSTR006706 [Laodelphax striatellus]|uniref:MADF domain-containing protein n=1 Tax=Laodelphax striatellus TaxID=195883 RepID=A0A482X8P1_LAOST|nr:hypothetical protein LSTR_LSTR006706 [Laodelphax striatellus]
MSSNSESFKDCKIDKSVIDAVKQRPLLYSNRHTFHDNLGAMIDRLWREVAAAVFASSWDSFTEAKKSEAEECVKRRWRLLRARFARILAMEREGLARVRGPLYDAMTFLLHPNSQQDPGEGTSAAASAAQPQAEKDTNNNKEDECNGTITSEKDSNLKNEMTLDDCGDDDCSGKSNKGNQKGIGKAIKDVKARKRKSGMKRLFEIIKRELKDIEEEDEDNNDDDDDEESEQEENLFKSDEDTDEEEGEDRATRNRRSVVKKLFEIIEKELNS